jgi:hypothetical protein
MHHWDFTAKVTENAHKFARHTEEIQRLSYAALQTKRRIEDQYKPDERAVVRKDIQRLHSLIEEVRRTCEHKGTQISDAIATQDSRLCDAIQLLNKRCLIDQTRLNEEIFASHDKHTSDLTTLELEFKVTTEDIVAKATRIPACD